MSPGLVDFIAEGEEPTDGLPYPTLAYTNGPRAGRPNLTGVDTSKLMSVLPGILFEGMSVEKQNTTLMFNVRHDLPC